jgi:hypothetical protein
MEENKKRPDQIALLDQMYKEQPLTKEMTSAFEEFIESQGYSIDEELAFMKRLLATAFLEKEMLEQSMALSTLEATIVGYGHATIQAYSIYVGRDGTDEQQKLGEEAPRKWDGVAHDVIMKACDDSLVDGKGLQALAAKAQNMLATESEGVNNKVIAGTMLAALGAVTKTFKARFDVEESDTKH